MKIAVIGRSLKSARWEMLFDILEQGREAEVWEYVSYEVDKLNKTEFDRQKFDYHILVATKPISEEIPNIRFTITATEEDIVEKMQELADSIGEEDGNSTDNAPSDVDVWGECDTKDTENDSVHDSVPTVHEVCDIPFAVRHSSDGDSDAIREQYNYLVGIKIEIDGQDKLITYKEALQLKEMMEIMKEYGYKIKSVIIDNTYGDD